MSTFIRKVKTKSGATAIQIVIKIGRQVTKLIHVGSAHDPERLRFLISVAKAKIHEGQISLFPEQRPPVIFQEKAFSQYLYDQFLSVYQWLHFDQLTDDVFAQLVIARLIETTQSFGYKKEDKVERRVIYQYKQKRAQLDLSNIDKQVVKAERIVNGHAPLKKAPFLTLAKRKPILNQELINEHRLRAGIKGYVTNLPTLQKDRKHGVLPQEIINAYHQLFQVEKSFRMSKSDLKARPIFHRKLDSIKAHLTIVFVALAIARFVEDKTNISIRKFIQKLRVIQTGVVTIEGKKYQTQPSIPSDIQQLISKLGGH